MNTTRAVLLDAGSLGLEDLHWQALRDCFGELSIHDFTRPDDVSARIAEADVVLTNKNVLDGGHFAAATKLKQIIVLATGTNNVDLSAARTAGIDVCNNRDYSTHSVVEHTISLILALARRLPAYHAQVENGAWQRSRQFCLLQPTIQGLYGATLGIVGFGAAGKGVASVARALGMEVIALASQRPHNDDTPRLPLAPLLAAADVLSIHCPLSDESRGLIGREQLRQMKPDALLVNTARGGIVVEADLAEALDQGWIAGAATDVLSVEPPRGGNPLLACHHPNLIITPHVAWGSISSRQNLIDQTVSIVHAYQNGRLINCVNA